MVLSNEVLRNKYDRFTILLKNNNFLSQSNCHICDDQVVITDGKWSFWRTLDGKYLYLRLIPFANCICISSRQEEELWVGRVKGAGREGAGYHRNSLCNGLITYSSSGSSFCKRPSYKINMNHNIIIIIINTIFTTTNQIKLMQVGCRILCDIGACVGPHDMTIWGRVRLMLICCG